MGLRYDPERAAWDYLTSLHCSRWLEGYLLGVGNAQQLERVFDSHGRAYDSFLLDEHSTTRYVHVVRAGEHVGKKGEGVVVAAEEDLVQETDLEAAMAAAAARGSGRQRRAG